MNIAQCMIFTIVKSHVSFFSFTLGGFIVIVLYHPLQVGDRVVQGPDWQWGSQGLGEEGTVMLVKQWKDTEGIAVRIDDGGK